MNDNKFSKELLEILLKAVDRKIYGSVEIYFEDGKVTQITQRIISKVARKEKTNNLKSVKEETRLSAS